MPFQIKFPTSKNLLKDPLVVIVRADIILMRFLRFSLHILTDIQCRPTAIQTDIQINRRTHRQTDKQTRQTGK